MKLRILCLGDIVGSAGRAIFQKHISVLKKKYGIDACIVNGENSANGRGITPKIMKFFKNNGVDVVTSGNHIWHHKEIYEYLNQHDDLLRPANFPSDCPGVGVTTFNCKGIVVGVINIQGRIFMREQVSCPFRSCDSLLTYLQPKTNVILVDFHAETTSEKNSLGQYLDGAVSALFGTHTHIQTADHRILPRGTAYITDLGMAGALNSSIGMQSEQIIHHMLTQMPVKFMVETKGPMVLSGIWVEIETSTGKATAIEPVRIIDEDIIVTELVD